MTVPKRKRTGKIVIAGIMLLVLASAGLLAACQPDMNTQAEAQEDETCELPSQEVAMYSGEVDTSAVTIPPIDLAQPEQVETATFALG